MGQDLVKRQLVRIFYSKAGCFELRTEQAFVNTQTSSTWSQQKDEEKTTFVYSTANGNNKLYANSNMYLVFEYKDPNGDYTKNRQVYISYSHFWVLKNTLRGILNDLANPNSFIQNNSAVATDFVDPVTINNIGKKATYLGFKLIPVDIGDNVFDRGVGIVFPPADAESASKMCCLNFNEFSSLADTLLGISLFTLEMIGLSVYSNHVNMTSNPYAQDNTGSSYSNAGSRSSSSRGSYAPPAYGDNYSIPPESGRNTGTFPGQTDAPVRKVVDKNDGGQNASPSMAQVTDEDLPF